MIKYHQIKGKIKVITGLHIGGSKDNIEIGGMDNPVIKDPVSHEPYIPGSSLKGKMRSIMEWNQGVTFDDRRGGLHNCSKPECPICKVFGSSAANSIKDRGPTRLIVRDAYLDKETLDKFESGQPLTEAKYENTINRIDGGAIPRHLERVVRGTTFDLEIIYRVFEESDINYFYLIPDALCAIQKDALGGCSSRGCGKVEFNNITLDDKPVDLLQLDSTIKEMYSKKNSN